MKVILFHKAPLGLRMPTFENEPGAKAMIRTHEIDRRYWLQQRGDIVTLRYQWCYDEQPVDQTIEIPLKPRTYLSFWYRPGLRRTDVLSEFNYLDNARFATHQHSFANYWGIVGRVIITSTEALLYLRGRIDDIAGFDNVVVPREENGTRAMGHYSAEAKQMLEDLQAKRDAVASYCVHDKVATLEKRIEALENLLREKATV